MSNLTVKRNEVFFLRNEIIKKYASLLGYVDSEFEKGLTGTIGIYEKIADVICDYIDDEKNLTRYAAFIQESALKIQLQKIIQAKEEDRKRYLRDLKGYVSANVVRKLIFYGPNEDNQTFKEKFITACYFYLHQDRHLFLKNNISSVNDGTIPPQKAEYPAGGATLPVFDLEPKFSLTILNDTNEVDPAKKILEFKGPMNALNRANLDPDNLTITSKVQAEINYANGEWFLKNKSQLGTTFILVDKPMKISRGDIIVLGNKRFLFDEPGT